MLWILYNTEKWLKWEKILLLELAIDPSAASLCGHRKGSKARISRALLVPVSVYKLDETVLQLLHVYIFLLGDEDSCTNPRTMPGIYLTCIQKMSSTSLLPAWLPLCTRVLNTQLPAWLALHTCVKYTTASMVSTALTCVKYMTTSMVSTAHVWKIHYCQNGYYCTQVC